MPFKMNLRSDSVLVVTLTYFLVENVSAGLFTPEGIKAQLEKYRVVPEVVDEAPQEEIEVKYTGDLMIQMGNFVPLNRVMLEPVVKWNADPKYYYTITLVDADWLNVMVPKKLEYQQWMILNIPGSNITEGELLTEYMGPKPSKAHAYHRYVFIMWKHPFVHFRELRVRGGQLPIYRENFNTKKFTEKYEANGLGKPYAINFFRTCVPKDDDEE